VVAAVRWTAATTVRHVLNATPRLISTNAEHPTPARRHLEVTTDSGS
jgi:hypothetical protein